MKQYIKVALVFLFLSNAFLSFGQQETIKLVKYHSFKLEYARAFTGSGDIYGRTINLEYSRQLSKYFSIAPSIGMMQFNAPPILRSDYFSSEAKAKSIGVTSYFRPVNKRFFSLELGLGTFVRNWEWEYKTGDLGKYGSVFIGDFGELGSNSFATQNYTTVGYTASLGAVFNLSKSVALSARLVYQNDTMGDNAISARPGLIIKF